ncbi:MAG: MauE/DoxX family redox-associated membrane protein [Ignavibacteria bacterium]
MTHTYKISGMTCSSCAAKVKEELQKLPEVINADINLSSNTAAIEMNKHISTAEFQKALDPLNKYKISEDIADSSHEMMHEETKTWLETYKPLIVIFIYITGISILTLYSENNFSLHNFMNKFMAGFFLVFSFFKFLDLKGFAESYSTYDLLAKNVNTYGYVYPFIELALGVAYLTSFNPLVTNIATIIVMGFSSIGVIQTVLDKKVIRCACLGSVFNLPMTTVTIVEDLLMVLMAVMALII